MPYLFTDYINEVDSQLSRFVRSEKKVVTELGATKTAAMETSKTYAAVALVLCCSAYEMAIYSITESMCAAKGYSIGVTNYFGDDTNKLLPSANKVHLENHLERFSKSLASDFRKSLNEAERSAINNLYVNRNKLAHKRGYDNLATTLHDVVEWHKQAKSLFRKYEMRLRKAI